MRNNTSINQHSQDKIAVTNPIASAENYLEQRGLLHSPGAVLYSSIDTLARGPVYFMGLNPGGGDQETSTLADNIAAARRGNNAYLDEQWAPGGRLKPAGQAVLQKRIKSVADLLELDLRDVPASNLAFTRSRRVGEHLGFEEAVRLCAPVHRIFLDVVRPRFLFTFGNIDHFKAGFELSEVETLDAMHQNWKAYRGVAKLGDLTFQFGNVPHLSVWGGDRKVSVLKWALEKASRI